MTHPPIKYNPAFLSDDELSAAFVVRHDDRDIVLKIIRENTVEANQHILVIGPRGIGKTMLMQRITLDVQQSEELSQRWYPLVFAEESYEVGSPGEFWLEAIFHLANQTGDANWQRTYEDLRNEMDEERLSQRALAQLMDFADSQKRRILLVVENLNMILGQQITDDCAWKLRHTLMHESRVMLLATATAQLDLPKKTNKAFFELFKTHHLYPLDDEDCQTIWESIAGHELGPRRIRALSILTGGNPRLLTIISHFGAKLSFSDLMKDLTALVDDHTDYFKSHLEALPSTERKVYVALADIWDPALARDVANAARLEVSKTSSLLKRLVGRGVVTEIPDKGRKKRYRVTERMYNVYYLMRRRGAPSERVRAAVHFMVQFYEEKDLVEIARRLGDEACKLPCDQRQLHYCALERIISSVPTNLQPIIIGNIQSDFLEAKDRPKSLKKLMENITETKSTSSDHEEFGPALAEATNLVLQGKSAQAIEKIQSFIGKTTDPSQLALMNGLIFEFKEKYQEAEEEYRKGLEHNSNNAMILGKLAHLLQKYTSNLDEAEDLLLRALDLDVPASWPWTQIGIIREAKKNYKGAEEAYKMAIDEAPDYEWAWIQLSHLLYEQSDRYDESEQALRKVTELIPEYAGAWGLLGSLLHEHSENYEYAELSYRKAIEFSTEHPWPWIQLGRLLCEQLNRISEAEDAFKKAISIDSNDAEAWGRLGMLLHDYTDRYEEVESAYRKVTKLEPASPWAWAALGDLWYRQMNNNEEAIIALKKATELDKSWETPWSDLVELYLVEQNNPIEALTIVQNAVSANPHDYRFINDLVWIYYISSDSTIPERILELSEDVVNSESNANYRHTFACLLARCNRSNEALDLAKKLLSEASFIEGNIDEMVILFAELAAGGKTTQAISILRDSASAVALEPILAALRLHAGEVVHIAPEIEQVAKDVLKEFELMTEKRVKINTT